MYILSNWNEIEMVSVAVGIIGPDIPSYLCKLLPLLPLFLPSFLLSPYLSLYANLVHC